MRRVYATKSALLRHRVAMGSGGVALAAAGLAPYLVVALRGDVDTWMHVAHVPRGDFADLTGARQSLNPDWD